LIASAVAFHRVAALCFAQHYHSLKSPACSCASITLPAEILKADHSVMQPWQAKPYIKIRRLPDLQDAQTLRIKWLALTGLAKF
jgi:hypothetical protein